MADSKEDKTVLFMNAESEERSRQVVLGTQLKGLQRELDTNIVFVKTLNLQLLNETSQFTKDQNEFLVRKTQLLEAMVFYHSLPTSSLPPAPPPSYNLICNKFASVKATAAILNERIEQGDDMRRIKLSEINEFTEQDIEKMTSKDLEEALKLIKEYIMTVFELKSYFVSLKQEWDTAKSQLITDLNDCIQGVTALMENYRGGQSSGENGVH